jgi:hypothetical protein
VTIWYYQKDPLPAVAMIGTGTVSVEAIEGLDAAGRPILWFGPPGVRLRMKLALDTWLAIEVEAAAEAAACAARMGIAAPKLGAALDHNPLAPPRAAAKPRETQTGDHRADFAVEWALDDFELMRDSAGSHHAPIAAAVQWVITAYAITFGGLVVLGGRVAKQLLGITPGVTLSFLPVIVLTIIFGLSNDYEVFVVSRIKEQYDRSRDVRGSVRSGLAYSSRVGTLRVLERLPAPHPGGVHELAAAGQRLHRAIAGLAAGSRHQSIRKGNR